MQRSMFMRRELLLLVPMIVLAATVVDVSSQEIHSIGKRYLRWDGRNIKPNSQMLPEIEVNYFVPHINSEKPLETGDFTGFTVYSRNGQLIEPGNVGVFAFVSTDNAKKGVREGKCKRATYHAGAYYHIYQKCPEEDSDIVAAGHCRVQGTLRFNSRTFNVNSQPYLNQEYYQNSDRSVNPTEQSYFKPCIEEWADSMYPLVNWNCSITGDGLMVTGYTQPLVSNSSESCNACGDILCGGQQATSVSVPVFTVTLFAGWVVVLVV